MKRKIDKIIISTLGILLLFTIKIYCEEDYIKNAGTVTSISECEGSVLDDYEECIVLNYKNGTLHIKHMNTTYNCCFEDIKAKIEIIFEKIHILSYENFGDRGPCD